MNRFLDALRGDGGLLDKLRGSTWLIVGLVLALLVAVLHPAQIGVLVWCLCKLSVAAYLGYWIDRTIYPYARPHTVQQTDQWLALHYMLRRAAIIAAAIIGMALGV